jgi:hypothetical protein
MTNVEREILSLLSEDHYGLWEIEVQVPVGRDLLKEAIGRLLADGLADWFRRDNDTAEAHPILTESEQPDLDLNNVWQATPLDAKQLLLGGTEAGYAAYFGRPVPST